MRLGRIEADFCDNDHRRGCRCSMHIAARLSRGRAYEMQSRVASRQMPSYGMRAISFLEATMSTTARFPGSTRDI
ncbi:hypothetical protein BJA5080_05474 [Bradyrhizobium diazoefficiens SEMIA 5080]|uniref:Uncharacterized protein n=1 Tax=Bradyrhizobium diazoefficiens SEMIA 5080 TaxID=754504 RepID=A0A837C332_9BRAD|nr:hypothetical protein BJA5080_05474 [Bradyrhizobium diazoefficiens SEMIA 5080]